MEAKIQLLHPQGKKAVSISRDKYDLLRAGVLDYFSKNENGTFSDISKSIAQELKKRKIRFSGSMDWYLEWVKLDLEARNIIARIPKKSPQVYILITN